MSRAPDACRAPDRRHALRFDGLADSSQRSSDDSPRDVVANGGAVKVERDTEAGASAAGLDDPADPDIAEPPAHWAQAPAVVGLVVVGSIWGVLIRLGLTAIWTFAGTPVRPLLWSQIVGCALMGFFVASKKGIENQHVLDMLRPLTDAAMHRSTRA